MARIKQAARKGLGPKGGNDVHSALPALQPELAPSHPSQHHSGEVMDLTDDSSSDQGGVALELPDAETFKNIEGSRAPNVEAHSSYQPSNVYLQDPAISILPHTQLWQLPVEPVQYRTAKDLRPRVGNGPAFIYHKSSKIIQLNWNCRPADALPDMFHDSTPYSLILLLQLRVLASHAKKNRLHVHAVLHGYWLQRVSALGIEYPIAERSFVTTTVSNVLGEDGPKRQDCEAQIQENIFGIMLEDVQRAMHGGAKVHLKHIVPDLLHDQSPQMARGELTPYQAAAMQDLQTRVQNNKYTGRTIDSSLQPTSETTAAGAKKLARQRKAVRRAAAQLRDFEKLKQKIARGKATQLRAARFSGPQVSPPSGTLSLNDVRAARMGLENDEGQQPNDFLDLDVEEYSHLSKHERQAYNQIASTLKSGVHVQDDSGSIKTNEAGWVKGSRAKKHKRRNLVDKAERRAAESNTLPSERFDLSIMPTLSASISTAHVGEMTTAMNALDLGRLRQRPLPPPLVKAGTNLSDQDNMFFRR